MTSVTPLIVAMGLLAAGIVPMIWIGRHERRRREALEPWRPLDSRPMPRRWRLYGACWLLAAAALLPSSIAVPSASTASGAVVLAVDVSRSMLTRDVAPDRLRASLALLQQAVGSQRGRLFGVVAFAADAMVACPLTPDTDAVTTALSLLVQRPIVGGTSIANGLRTAGNMLKAAATPGTIVLVSDGEDFGDPLDGVISDLRDANIVVIVVAAGTEAGGVVPSEPATAASPGSMRGPSRLNVPFLTRLANETGGTSLRLTSQQVDIGSLLATHGPPAPRAAVGPWLGSMAVAFAAAILVLELFGEFGSRQRVRL